MSIVKYQRQENPQELHKEYVAAMWLQFLRCPSKPTAPGEIVDLGEIGEVELESQRIDRWCPYAPCQRFEGDELSENETNNPRAIGTRRAL